MVLVVILFEVSEVWSVWSYSIRFGGTRAKSYTPSQLISAWELQATS